MNASNYFSTVCTEFTLSHFVLSKARKSTHNKVKVAIRNSGRKNPKCSNCLQIPSWWERKRNLDCALLVSDALFDGTLFLFSSFRMVLFLWRGAGVGHNCKAISCKSNAIWFHLFWTKPMILLWKKNVVAKYLNKVRLVLHETDPIHVMRNWHCSSHTMKKITAIVPQWDSSVQCSRHPYALITITLTIGSLIDWTGWKWTTLRPFNGYRVAIQAFCKEECTR